MCLQDFADFRGLVGFFYFLSLFVSFAPSVFGFCLFLSIRQIYAITIKVIAKAIAISNIILVSFVVLFGMPEMVVTIGVYVIDVVSGTMGIDVVVAVVLAGKIEVTDVVEVLTV